MINDKALGNPNNRNNYIEGERMGPPANTQRKRVQNIDKPRGKKPPSPNLQLAHRSPSSRIIVNPNYSLKCLNVMHH